jgi:K+-sensing histidine kinase KdpD
MGTQGSGAIERVLFGSNTVAAMKHLSWPLIVVPAEAKYTRIRKIGLACDMKDVTDATPIQEIRSLTKEFGATLDVIHINTGDDNKYGPEIVSESGLLQELLYELNPKYHFLDHDNIEEGLSSFAETNKLDLLIVVPKKHKVIQSLFHKSHAKKLVLHTHLPVMAVHE